MFLLWLYPQTHQLAIFTYSMKRVAFACNQGLALLGFFPYAILFPQSQINNPDPRMFFFIKKTLWLFSWMGFNCLKARMRTTLRRQFTFYHQLSSQKFLALIFYQPLKDKKTQILKSDPKKGVSVVANMLLPRVDEGFWLYIYQFLI